MQRSMKLSVGLCTLALMGLVSLAVEAQAATAPPPPRPLPPVEGNTSTAPNGSGRLSINNPSNTSKYAPNPRFSVGVDPRKPLTGWSFGLFGGVNIYNEGELENVGGAATSDDSRVGGAGGIKFGYTWPFGQHDDIPETELFEDHFSNIQWAGGLEVEAFYFGKSSEVSVGNRTDVVDIDGATFMVNALLKAQSGPIRAYAGPGVGFSLTHASNWNIGNDSGTDDSVNFTWQVMAGFDYFLHPEWSLFTEYKYLVQEDVDYYGGNSTLDFGRHDNHLLLMGLRTHF